MVGLLHACLKQKKHQNTIKQAQSMHAVILVTNKKKQKELMKCNVYSEKYNEMFFNKQFKNKK